MSNVQNFGMVLKDITVLESYSPTKLRETVFSHSWLLVREAHYDMAKFRRLSAQLGGVIEYGFGTVLNMEAKKGSRESQFTNASMPLHQDAILNASDDAQFLVFRCLEAPTGNGGETLLTNNRRFMSKIPRKLHQVLRSVQFEYKPMASGYYKTTEERRDIRIPPLKRHPETGEELPFFALDDPTDPQRNYACCVSGYSPQDSKEILEWIDRMLREPDVLHTHQWQVGDLLILDNFLVCHGRNSSTDGTPRRLERIAIRARGA